MKKKPKSIKLMVERKLKIRNKMKNIKGLKTIDIPPQDYARDNDLIYGIKFHCEKCGKDVKLKIPAKSCGYVGFIGQCDCGTDKFHCYFEKKIKRRKK